MRVFLVSYSIFIFPLRTSRYGGRVLLYDSFLSFKFSLFSFQQNICMKDAPLPLLPDSPKNFGETGTNFTKALPFSVRNGYNKDKLYYKEILL